LWRYASAQPNRLDPWVYLKHVLTELPARRPGADLTDLLPDMSRRSRCVLTLAVGS
jgi:hypothetical protein